MHVVDPTIDLAAVDALLDREFGDHDALEFVPAGGDSWCFLARPWWVSVRRDRSGHVPNAYDAATRLRDAGLDFVLAPARGRRNGRAVHQAAGRPVVVFAHIAGHDLWPGAPTAGQLSTVESMITTLHAACVDVDLPHESYDTFFTVELDRGVHAALLGATDAGPFGGQVTELVRKNRRYIDDLRREMDAVQAGCRGMPTLEVLTHGEPSNVFVTDTGDLLLMDWGVLAWGPPERDWRALIEMGIEPPPSLRASVVRFYELVWILGEIAEYIAQFTSPHDGNAADVAKWDELLVFLDP